MLPVILASVALSALLPQAETRVTPRSKLLRTAIEGAQSDLLSTTDVFEDHSTWETAWQVESRYYIVRTTHSRHLGVSIGESLDLAFGWFQAVLGTDWEPTNKLHVHIYPTIGDYNAFSNTIQAAEHSSFLGAYYAAAHADRPIALVYDANRTRFLMNATHAASHQFTTEAFNNQPPFWVDEGLAAYFSLYWDYAYLRAEHDRLRGDSFIPIRTLTNATAGNFSDRSHDKLMELGAFFNYLMHRRADTMDVVDDDGEVVQAPFRDLVRGAVRGKNLAFDPTYLSLLARLPQIETEFREYVFTEF